MRMAARWSATPVENLPQEGHLMSYLHPGYWHCRETYRDFIVLNDLWREGASWKVRE
jgi:glucose-1-phosphate cytidylyltransferase